MSDRITSESLQVAAEVVDQVEEHGHRVLETHLEYHPGVHDQYELWMETATSDHEHQEAMQRKLDRIDSSTTEGAAEVSVAVVEPPEIAIGGPGSVGWEVEAIIRIMGDS